MCIDGNFVYDPAFANALVAGYHFNQAAFCDDRQRLATTHCLDADQHLAQELGVNAAPDVVVFNTQTQTAGVKLGNTSHYQRLKAVCEKLAEPTAPAAMLHVL